MGDMIALLKEDPPSHADAYSFRCWKRLVLRTHDVVFEVVTADRVPAPPDQTEAR